MKAVNAEAGGERAGVQVWIYKKKKSEMAEQVRAAWNWQIQAQKQPETISRRVENHKLAEMECVVPMTSREEYYDRKEREDCERVKLDLVRAKAEKKWESRILKEKDVFQMVFGSNSNFQEPCDSDQKEDDEDEFLERIPTPVYRKFGEGGFLFDPFHDFSDSDYY